MHGEINRPEWPSSSPNASAQFREQPDGAVTGGVVDQTGNGVAGADVKLLRDQKILMGEVQTDDDGQFAFAHVSPGPLQFSIAAEGFTTQTVSGTLRSGEGQVFPPIDMSLAPLVTEIRVTPLMQEIAQEQFKEQERQRVFGIVPNFYVTYVNDAAPLSARQKFQLALKSSTDPVTVSAVAAMPEWTKLPIALVDTAKVLKATPNGMLPRTPTLRLGCSSGGRSW